MIGRAVGNEVDSVLQLTDDQRAYARYTHREKVVNLVSRYNYICRQRPGRRCWGGLVKGCGWCLTRIHSVIVCNHKYGVSYSCSSNESLVQWLFSGLFLSGQHTAYQLVKGEGIDDP